MLKTYFSSSVSVSESVTRTLIKLPGAAKKSQRLLIMAKDLESFHFGSATWFIGISFGSNEEKCENASLAAQSRLLLTTNHPRPPVAQTDLWHSSNY